MATSRKDLLDSLYSTFAALHQLIAMEKLQAIKGLDVHRSQIEILWLLSTAPHLSIGQIAEHRHISSSAATQIVDGLVEQKLVDRHQDPDDRRRMVISLNEQGRKELHQAKACILDLLGSRLQGLTDQQMATMISTFELLLAELTKTSSALTSSNTKG